MKYKYINTKVITSTISFALATTLVSGCSNNFEYKTNDDNNSYAIGNMSYSNFNNCYLLELYNKSTNKEEVYIVGKKEKDNNYIYVNIEDNATIYDTNNKNNDYDYICETDIIYYLIGLNEVKPNYTPNDVERIIKEIKDTYFEDSVKVRERINNNS